jgi:putative hydrolase of the HAD superfamily
MDLSLSYEQFSHGWQAVFVAIRPEVIDIMHKLREQGHRVVVLSNTNRLHTTFWPDEYPEVKAAADQIYLSQEMGMRKPEARIYQAVLQAEGFTAADAVFFDDNADNIEGANQLGITSILVTGKETIPTTLRSSYAKNRSSKSHAPYSPAEGLAETALAPH